MDNTEKDEIPKMDAIIFQVLLQVFRGVTILN